MLFRSDDAVREGIAINGLPILTDFTSLDRYYRDEVIGGPGAFIVVAEGFESFAEAIRKKMIIEIADLTSPHARWRIPEATFRLASSAYPPGCDIGERQSREFWQRRYQSPN